MRTWIRNPPAILADNAGRMIDGAIPGLDVTNLISAHSQAALIFA